MPFLDELASGIAPASTPDVAAYLGLSGGTAAAAMIVAFHALALFIEAPLLAWSERVSARWFSAGSIAVIALSLLLAAAFPRGWVLVLSLSIYGVAAGCALSVAEGLLVETSPESSERTLARASIAANAGDLAVPALLAMLAWVDLGWRAACVAAGLFALGLAIVHASAASLDRPTPADADDEHQEHEESLTVRETLRMAFSHRPLLGWSFACALTGLLDEVLVAFSAVHLDGIGMTATQRSWAIAAWVLGGFAGLAAVDRFVDRIGSRRFLLIASLATVTEVLLLATTRAPVVGAIAMFAIGVSGSTLHPLTKARSYATLPHRPALVNAVASGMLLFDMAAPIALAVVAAYAGPPWAIAGLLVAPVGVAVAAWRFDAA